MIKGVVKVVKENRKTVSNSNAAEKYTFNYIKSGILQSKKENDLVINKNGFKNNMSKSSYMNW